MQILEFKSDKEYWAFRKQHIGASDASIIMGASKWKLSDGRTKTPYLLWEEKLGFEELKVNTAATQYGQRMEEPARQVYNEMKGEVFTPKAVKNAEFLYLMASLDGLNDSKTKCVEIKNPNEKDHELAKSGKIPPHYIPQVQMQLLVTGFDEMDYFSFHKGEGVIVTVKRDEEYIKKMIDKLRKFWDYVENLEAPPLTDDDYVKQDLQWQAYARELYLVKKEKRKLCYKEKELLQKLKSMCGHRNAYFGPYRLKRSISLGRVDYNSIPELLNVNLDDFRGEPKESWYLHKGDENGN